MVNFINPTAASSTTTTIQPQQQESGLAKADEATASSLEKAILTKLANAQQNDSQSTDDTETTDSIDLAASGSTGAASNLNEEIEHWRKWQEGNKKKLFQTPDQQAIIFRKQQEEMIKKMYLSSSSSTSSASSLSSASIKSGSSEMHHLKFKSLTTTKLAETKGPVKQTSVQRRADSATDDQDHDDHSANSSTSEASSPSTSSTSSYKIEIDNLTNSNGKDEDDEEAEEVEMEEELINSSSVSQDDGNHLREYHQGTGGDNRTTNNNRDDYDEEENHHDYPGQEDDEDEDEDEDYELSDNDLKLIEAYKLLAGKFGLDKLREELLNHKEIGDAKVLSQIASVLSEDSHKPASGKEAESGGQVDAESIRKQLEHQNNRLSTILETTCEENSPLKKPSTRHTVAKQPPVQAASSNNVPQSKPKQLFSKPTKKAPTEEPKETENQANEDVSTTGQPASSPDDQPSRSVVDVDSIQIGVKATNQMSFEQIIEEKLKIADQLDREQAKYGSANRPKIVKKASLQSKRASLTSSSAPSPVVQQAPPAKPATSATKPTTVPSLNKPQTVNPSLNQLATTADFSSSSSNPVNSNEQAPQSAKQPCKYLRRGEGLKRFQPKSKRNSSASSERNHDQQPDHRPNRQTASGSSSTTGSKTTTATSSTNPKVLRSNSTSSMPSAAPTTVPGGDKNAGSKPQQLLKSQSTANVLTTTANKRPSETAKLKPASQIYSTVAPPVRRPAANDFADDDGPNDESDELKEFETLEQYAEEHASFRSSISYVESVLTHNNTNGTLVSSTSSRFSTGSNQSARGDEFGNVNSKVMLFGGVQVMQVGGGLLTNRLGGLVEEEDDDCHDDNSPSQHFNDQEDEDDGFFRRELQLARLQSQSTTSLASSSRSASASGGQVVVRKIKRLSGNDQLEHTAPKASSNSVNKKYNRLNYESDDDQLDSDETSCESHQEREDNMFARMSGEMSLQHQQPKTSSRSSSSEKAVTNRQFNDSRPWTGDEDEPRDDESISASYGASNTSELIRKQISDLNSQLKSQKAVHQFQQQQHRGYYGNHEQDNEDERQESAESAPVVSQLITKLFPSLSNNAQKENEASVIERLKQKQPPAPPPELNSNAALLKEKLAQLEAEIERFQKKNAELAKLKEKFESELKIAETSKKAFEKQKELELRSLKEVHEEEMKKLTKEKKLFEQHRLAHRDNHPDRREREEMDRLKKQLVEMGEEMKLKETRWLANNNRLKERIEKLEDEKRELKQELQLMEKKRIESLLSSTHQQQSNRLSTSSVPSATGQQTTSRESSSARSNLSIPSTSSVLTCSSSASVSSGYMSSNHPNNNLYQELSATSSSSSLTTAPYDEEDTLKAASHTHKMMTNEMCKENNLMKLKRCLSEKSLSSSTSSTVSSMSSASNASSALPANPVYAQVINERMTAQQLYQKQPLATGPMTTTAGQNAHLASIVQASEALSKYVNSNYFSNPVAPPAATTTTTTTTATVTANRPNSSTAGAKTVKFKMDYSPHEILTIDHTPQAISRSSISPRALKTISGDIAPTATNQHHLHQHPPSNIGSSNYHGEPLIRDHFSSAVTGSKLGEPEYLTSLIQPNKRVRVIQTLTFDKYVEKHLEDGGMRITYTNGTIKEVSNDKEKGVMQFYNGDRKEWDKSLGIETYFHARDKITENLLPDGTKVLNFATGQVEKVHQNGTKEIFYVDGSIKIYHPNGTEETRLTNGTVIRVEPNNVKVIEYTNKQREIHTSDFKRREYPDGTIKTVYNDGLVETRYASGQIRIKDAAGNVIRDR